MDLHQIRQSQLWKGVLVPEENVDHPVAHKGRERVGDGDFLSAALGTRRDKDTAHLACNCRLAPEQANGVPECLTDLKS